MLSKPLTKRKLVTDFCIDLSLFGKHNFTLLVLFLTSHLKNKGREREEKGKEELAKRHFTPSFFSISSRRRVCVLVLVSVYASLMASVVRKRGPVTHSQRPYVWLHELGAHSAASCQKTLGEQRGVITHAP